MVLEHVGMPQPGDCRVVFSASTEELEAAIQAEQAAENPPQAEAMFPVPMPSTGREKPPRSPVGPKRSGGRRSR